MLQVRFTFMQKNLLFPNRFKKLFGWCFYLLFLIGGYLYFTDNMEHLRIQIPNFFGMEGLFIEKGFWIKNYIIDELFTLLIILFGIIHCFSKEKVEDELINTLRIGALTWSFYVNYLLVGIATLIFYDEYYFTFMVANIFTLLILFNLRFHNQLGKHYRS